MNIRTAVAAMCLALAILFPHTHAADPAATLCPYRFEGKWGYVEAGGSVAIPFRFEAARDFSPFGLAAVKLDGKWGFIDGGGAQAVPARFDEAGDFSAANGTAPVKLGDAWGYIDAKGETVLPFDLIRADGFRENGLAHVVWRNEANGQPESSSMNIKGEKFSYFDIGIGANGLVVVWDASRKKGFIDSSGNIVVPIQYDDAEAFTSAGLAKVNLGKTSMVKRDGKWGLINAAGELVVPIIYDDISYRPFEKSALARVKLDDRYGYIDKRGEVVVPIVYEDASLVLDDTAIRVKMDGKWGVVSLESEERIPFIYEALESFTPNGLAVMKRNGKSGFVNAKGEEIIPPTYDTLWRYGASGLASAKRDGKWGCIDADNRVAVPFDFDEVMGFDDKGIAPARNGRKWGFINTKGETVIPFLYEQLTSRGGFAENGLARARLDGKWGYIDRKGDAVIPFKYQDARDFGDMLSRPDGSRGLFGLAGVEDGEPRFDISNYAQVSLGRFDNGIIDATGEPVVPLRFNTVFGIDEYGWASLLAEVDKRLAQGFMHVKHGWYVLGNDSRRGRNIRSVAVRDRIRVRKDGLYGYVDLRGETVVPPVLEAATDFSTSGLAMVREDGVIRCIDTNGDTVLKESGSTPPALVNARGEVVWPK